MASIIIKLNNSYQNKITELVNLFDNNVIIESNFDSCLAVGKLIGDNYKISSKSKYYNDEVAKKIMLDEFIKFISKSKLYQRLIQQNSLVLSVPKNTKNKDNFDLAEWIVAQISDVFSITNITPYLHFYKDGDLKPTLLKDGKLIHKTIEEKTDIINNAKLRFDKDLEQYKNRKIILIDNIHDSGITTQYIVDKLRKIIQPKEIHCLYYSKM